MPPAALPELLAKVALVSDTVPKLKIPAPWYAGNGPELSLIVLSLTVRCAPASTKMPPPKSDELWQIVLRFITVVPIVKIPPPSVKLEVLWLTLLQIVESLTIAVAPDAL